MNKKLAIIVNVDIPKDYSPEYFVELIRDYMKLNRFTTEIENITLYPINYKLRIEHLELPNPLVN